MSAKASTTCASRAPSSLGTAALSSGRVRGFTASAWTKLRCRRTGQRAANLLAHLLLHMAKSTGNRLFRALARSPQNRSTRSRALATTAASAAGPVQASSRACHRSSSRGSRHAAGTSSSSKTAAQSCATGSTRVPASSSALPGGPAWRARSRRQTCTAMTSKCCSDLWYSASWARMASPLRTQQPLRISAAKRSVRTACVRIVTRTGEGKMSDQSPLPASARISKFMHRISTRSRGTWKDDESMELTTRLPGDASAAERAEYHGRSSSSVASGLRQ
mmetsp:Transcript_5716/g.16596  ORF Transcript_5716/g.16596 Transcript_5716/m.16596 type:complete len:277 (+) Transcript_5716:3019-3849(+)